jgi:hypothetical protein
MSRKKRKVGSLKRELITKSREAALTAIRVFNDPQVTFKSETYIVLMVIAWTYLLHAYYRSKGIEYRYYKQGAKRKIFSRTKNGNHKYWELERCLDCDDCPVHPDAKANLKFLIGLRHEIEHQMTKSLDNYLSGRYQACALNYNEHIKQMFGGEYGVDSQLTYSIQFLQLAAEQLSGPVPEAQIPDRLKAYLVAFDSTLSPEQFASERFSFRLVFSKKLVNHPGQADRVIEFIDSKSELAQQIDKERWVKREVERPKYRAKDIVAMVRKAGFKNFRVTPEHSRMWKRQDAKDPAKGFGVEVQGLWFWYDSWAKRCIELCTAAGDVYK